MEQLIENMELDEAVLDGDLIRNVKLLGPLSKNKRSYPAAVLEKSLNLFQGKSIYFNHQKGERKYQDKGGFIQEARFHNDSVYGDILINSKHPNGEQVKWDIEHRTPNSGFSINARGVCKNGLVESIDEINSVDIVDDPATTKNFFESVQLEIETKQAENTALKEDLNKYKSELISLQEQVNKLNEIVETVKKKNIVNKLPEVKLNTINQYQDWLNILKENNGSRSY